MLGKALLQMNSSDSWHMALRSCCDRTRHKNRFHWFWVRDRWVPQTLAVTRRLSLSVTDWTSCSCEETFCSNIFLLCCHRMCTVGYSVNFWQRVSIACYAERCLSHDRFCLTARPSVRLSVTRWYHAKMTPATIMRSSLEDSTMTLVSSTLDLTAKFQREHRERGRRMRKG